ncbi:hypothetical protein M422DRAFT_160377, partial [Sphaerobolus stellatus SS14]
DITSAKGDVLNKYINNVNQALKAQNVARKQLLSKQGTVEAKKQRIATHYGIDLSQPCAAPSVPCPKPITVDEKIGEAQWAWVRQLAQEWVEMEAAGKRFLFMHLLDPSLPDDVLRPLRDLFPDRCIPDSSPAMGDRDRIVSLIGAARSGDMGSYKQLQALFPPALVAPTTGSVGIDVSPFTTSFIATPPTQSTSFSPPVSHDPPPSLLNTLTACNDNIEVLKCPTDIRGAIIQVRDGTVGRLRAKYGPAKGRDTHKIWQALGQQISKREHLHHDLEEEFGGDLERFIQYFTYTGKVRQQDGVVKTRSFCLLVEAIPKCKEALEAEQSKDSYKDSSGNFSAEKWRETWGAKNKWEIWDEIDPSVRQSWV